MSQPALEDFQIVKAMADAGIPKEFRAATNSLAAQGPSGILLASWITDAGIYAEIAQGRGRILAGSGVDAMRLFYLTARGLLLRGIGVRAYSLTRLIDTLCRDGEDKVIEDWDENIRVVCVSGFYNEHYKAPFTEHQLYVTEMFLRQQLMNNRPLILQANELRPAWWSKHFINHLMEKCEVIPV